MNEDGLGQRIKQAMNGESARSIAWRAGISDSTLRSILAGARPTVDNLAALARALGVGLDWLVTGAGSSGVPRGERTPLYAGPDALADDAPPTEAIELPPALVRTRFGCAALAAVTVGDDAMAPTLAEGDVALVDRDCGRLARDGVYIMVFEKTALLRRLQRAGAALIVEADNPAFRSWTIAAAQAAEVRLVGRVVGAIRRF